MTARRSVDQAAEAETVHLKQVCRTVGASGDELVGGNQLGDCLVQPNDEELDEDG